MAKLKGASLLPGAWIGAVAPASPVHSIEPVNQAVLKLTGCGFHLVLGATTRPGPGDLAGSDESRRTDLEQMWWDEAIKAIWCLRGGYGSIRLLPVLDYDLFRANPKPLIGFSDLTALELGIWSKTRLVTFHGPVLTTFDNEFSFNQALQMLTGAVGTGFVPLPWPVSGAGSLVTIHSGKAVGILLGGNLVTLCSLIGTGFLPDLRGAILFLEETGEAAYRIDRLLTQLLVSGLLESVAAVLVGRCIPGPGESEGDLIRVFVERLSCLNCPSAYGFPIGHIPEQWTIPQGIAAEVDTESGELVLLESPTSESS